MRMQVVGLVLVLVLVCGLGEELGSRCLGL